MASNEPVGDETKSEAAVSKKQESENDQKAEAKPGKKRRSMFDELDEFPGTQPKPNNEEKEIMGTLQSFFARGEGAGAATGTGKKMRRPKLIYENTYRLTPYRPFSSERVTLAIADVLAKLLNGQGYKSDFFSNLGIIVSEKVRARVLSLKFDRCKIIVLTHLGPLNKQGQHVGFRALWDSMRDSYASYTYKNADIYCNVVVFGVYFE